MENKIEDKSTMEALKFAVANGMIDVPHIQEQIEVINKENLLKKHPFSIWHGKDGLWRTYLPNGDDRKLVKRKTRSEIEDEVIKYWRDEIDSPTIKDVFQAMNDRKLELDKVSEATHTRNQQIFNRHFDKFGDRKIKAVSVDDFVEFLEEQIPRYDLTAKAFANLKGVTNAIIKYARRKKWIGYSMDDILIEMDVSEKDFQKSVKIDREEVFDEEETDAVVRYLILHPDVWNLGLLLLFVTGLRVGELVALKWEDVSPDTIFVRRTETRFRNEDGKWEYRIKDFPKTEAGVRIVAIPQSFQWIFEAIRKLHDDEEFVFVRDGGRLNTNCMRKRLEKVCDKVGIARRSPHKIRKTYCSILFENHLDTKLITKQMGHTDIMCSEIYYHRNRKSLDDAIKEISAIPEFQQKMTLIS